MPLTKISAPKHLESAKLKSLADAVQEGLVITCNVPPKDLFQLITRFESEEIILDPTFGGVNRSRDACIVEITFLRGRTETESLQAHPSPRRCCRLSPGRRDDHTHGKLADGLVTWFRSCLRRSCASSEERSLTVLQGLSPFQASTEVPRVPCR